MIIIIILLVLSLICNLWCIKGILDITQTINVLLDIIDIIKIQKHDKTKS